MKKLKDIVNQIKDIALCVKYFGTFAWKAMPIYYFFIFMSIVVNSVGPFISIIGSKYLINEIVYDQNRDINKIVLWVAFICLGTYIYRVLAKFANEKQFYCNNHFARMLDVKISTYTMRMKFEHTENSKMLDMMNKAEKAFQQTNLIQGITDGITSLVSNIIVLLGVFYIVVQCSVWLIIPIILSFVINSYISMKTTQLNEEYYGIYNDQMRVVNYYARDLTTSEYAKDIRVYNAADMLLDNQAKQGEIVYDTAIKYSKKQWNYERFGVVSVETCNICVYAIIAVNTLLGKVTIGDFSSLIQSILKFTEALNGIARGMFGLKYTTGILKYYLEYMEMIEGEQMVETDKMSEVPNVDKGVTVEFKNVSFKYPNTDVYILKNVSTKIRAGEHLSIVGKNGAGKTTFIKLLCRLYDVTEGEILVNGVNINDIDYNEYLKLLSVVFQDYKLMAFTIKENVDMGTGFEKVGNEESVDSRIAELCKIVGIDEWVDSLEKKQDTNLYKMFDESGVEPSGGQAQKLAIVRALYKNSPIVILDEPTAALDPIAEYEVYKNFDSLVGGKTAVYISHRLSSCRFCDRIIVFDGGGIIEDGNHEELMSMKNGFYRNMYDTQAKHYQG